MSCNCCEPVTVPFSTAVEIPCGPELHNRLFGRGDNGCHPTSAIEGLNDTLNDLESVSHSHSPYTDYQIESAVIIGWR